MIYKYQFLVFCILWSIEVSSQCLSLNEIVIRTEKSCSYFNNGVLTIKNLKAKTPYTILINERSYSYTANEYGTLSIYSLAPGTYGQISITDRVNSCPEIVVENPVVIDSWKNVIEGPVTTCNGETIKMNSTFSSTWTINSSIINFNATETSLEITDNNSVTVVAKALVEGCYERDTLHVQVEELPHVSLMYPDKSYCYNKLDEVVELAVGQGVIKEVYFNDEQIVFSPANIVQLNLGNSIDDNVLKVIAENNSECQIVSEIPLPFSGEAPTQDVEINWWPGNIFSIKSNSPELEYRWGWLNSVGEKTYAASESVSADGMHYFAGSHTVQVVDLIEKGIDSEYLLFVEYNALGEECYNSLLFNSAKMPIYRSQANSQMSGINLNAFPNPFVDNINISSSKLNGFEQLDLSIIDASGKRFYQSKVETTNGFLINLPTLEFPTGIYFIQLSHQGFTLLSQKVIKQ